VILREEFCNFIYDKGSLEDILAKYRSFYKDQPLTVTTTNINMKQVVQTNALLSNEKETGF
jgi:N-acetyl-gamma-glutamyl-phosphate reductase